MSSSRQEKLDRISKEVRRHYKNKTPFRIFHGSTNSTRTLTFKRSEMVDVSHLDKVLKVDTKNLTVTVEPNVPMDALVAETLKHNLVPPVIPEFPGITVGGAIQGGAGESSSFKWGFFSQTANWIEMILADGSVITCSPTENADLFYGTAGASGTLGIITAAEIKLIPAKKYVNLSFVPVASFKEANSKMFDASKAEYDFIDCIMYGPDHGCVALGQMSDVPAGKVKRFTRAVDEWYYLHVAKIDKKKKPVTRAVPLVDYLFRYDRGAFWVGRFAFERFKVPFNRLTRYLLNPLLHTRELYKALQDSGASQEHVVQDLTVSFDKANSFMEYIHKRTHIYPLWLCPLKTEPRSPLMCNGLDTPLAMNIGVWGPRMRVYEEFIALNRDLETKLMSEGGKKWMYAHSYYTKNEFWKIYDKRQYDKLRRKYKATNLPDIYEKTSINKRVEVHGKRALLNTIFGKAKLKIKD